MECFFLDSRFRGNDTLTRPTYGWPPLPQQGEASCFGRLTCYDWEQTGWGPGETS